MIKKTDRKKLVLLDAHAIIHRAYHALPGLTSPSGDPVGALYGVITMILKIVDELEPDYIVACFDLPQPTYRHEAYEDYKAGRQKTDDELVVQIQRSRDLIDVLAIPRYEQAGFEADDLLGTIVEQTRTIDDLDVVIASGDMDTLQLVEKKRVQVYTLKKGIHDTILYDEAAVKARFGFSPARVVDYKGLRGDPSDNIPGIKGIGEKTATTLIATFGGLDDIYKKLKKDEQPFRDAGITPRMIGLLKDGEDEAEFSRMLATIRRDVPVQFVLPATTWREGVNADKVLDFCATLGFRSLAPRLAAVLQTSAVSAEEEPEVSSDDLAETALALWLLESDQTNPSRDDIVAYARTKGISADFVSAREAIFAELARTPMQKVFDDIEKPLRSVLARMEDVGVKLDTEQLTVLSTQFHTEITALEAEIYAHAGAPFNINSPKQLGDILFDTLSIGGKRQKRTSTGQRSTKESELAKLVDAHPIIPHILRYRELQKLAGTYIDALPLLVKEDGRVHTHFLQAGTTTGRLASRDPNMQNIPIRGEFGKPIRAAFVAEQGYTLVAFDYSQIELRIAAFLAEDEELMRIFKAGEDIHTSVAARVFKIDADEVTTEMRRHAKVINFGIMYGMGVNALRENLGKETTREDAQQFLNAYFESFPRLAAYLDEVKAFAYSNGYTETLYGRRRYFPGIRSTIPYMRASAERMAINAPIQGTEADIVRIAMVRVHEYLAKENLLDDVRLLLQIHDELIFEIKKERVEEVEPKLRKIMQDVVPAPLRHDVPLAVGMKQGKSWGDIE